MEGPHPPAQFELARLDLYCERLLQHRDRFFSVVYSSGLCVTIAFWAAVFPSPAVPSINDTPAELVETLLLHGYAVLPIHVELMFVHHRCPPSPNSERGLSRSRSPAARDCWSGGGRPPGQPGC
jgi:hypothetical protein